MRTGFWLGSSTAGKSWLHLVRVSTGDGGMGRCYRLSKRRRSIVLSFQHMFSTTKDIWYFVASICLVGVSGFLMWTLYQLGKMGQQANQLVQETRKKMSIIERTVDELLEQVNVVTSMVGTVASVAQSAFGFFGGRKSSRRNDLRDEVRRLRDELDELAED